MTGFTEKERAFGDRLDALLSRVARGELKDADPYPFDNGVPPGVDDELGQLPAPAPGAVTPENLPVRTETRNARR